MVGLLVLFMVPLLLSFSLCCFLRVTLKDTHSGQMYLHLDVADRFMPT